MRSQNVRVEVNLSAIRGVAEEIRRATRSRLIAVVKADAYGLGAARVADALEGIADEFAYFSFDEALVVGKPGLVIGPPEGDVDVYRAMKLRPAIFRDEDAARFAHITVAVSVDTGMQRFACPLERLERYLAGGNVFDVFTHAMSLETVLSFHDAAGDRAKKRGAFIHAAASSLLHEPAAWMDGVRPGVALYEGAVRVTSRLISVQRTYGGVGYSGAQAPYVGLILAGYAHGLRHGPVSINGRRQQLIEVAMNSSFTTVDPRDQADDEVVLLGEELNERALAAHFASRPHEILCRYCSMGVRDYVEDDSAAALFGRGGALRVSAGAAQ